MHHCVPILDNGGKGLFDQMVLGGSSGPALTMKGNMKKVKSLKDLANLMESLGAVKDEEPGFTSWTLDCGPDRQKRQAASATKQTQLKDKIKT